MKKYWAAAALTAAVVLIGLTAALLAGKNAAPDAESGTKTAISPVSEVPESAFSSAAATEGPGGNTDPSHGVTEGSPDAPGPDVHRHNFEEWVTVRPATCLEDGVRERVCSCGEKERAAIPATGHDKAVRPAVEPTCTASGRTETVYCAVCGAVFSGGERIPAKGHKTSVVPAVEPTCTTAGNTKGEKCTVCGAILSNYVYYPPLGHQYGGFVTVREATCTSSGRMERTCGRCGDVDVRVLSARGHTPVKETAVSASCTALGRTEGSHCRVCGTVIKKAEIVCALGHDFKNNTCTRCGKTTGNAATAAFDAFKSYVWLVGKRTGDDYRTVRDPIVSGGVTYEYVWTYSPKNDAVTVSMTAGGRGTTTFFVVLTRAQTYLTWGYAHRAPEGSSALDGIMDFDRFDLNAEPLPFCAYSASDSTEYENALKTAPILAKALWARAGEDAAKLGISLDALG
ncbi:MAG: hypothetical protein IJU52_04805 [Clostridia bacterium]|nr:hypothetical protein [Clostridia bacterium]